ncbi:MAG: methyltransferase domain-containing protein [Desulfobacterales bacterium]|nr:methyltransferase domain-containing protein [Desulfobacterales bacterium]MBF0397294.1 methyltransferase domain-containing protein [Desulfobacterales bacterium]
MKQTPVHEIPNMDLLGLVPKNCKRIIEVGSSSGVLAREYKKINPDCHYIGIEIDPDYAALSKRFCDEVLQASIESLDDNSFSSLFPSDCWIFGDVLEHLIDPWSLLKRIRSLISGEASIVACLPNSQHWSIQAKINCGQIFYEDSGLLDRTHLRWFSRLTMIDLFQSTGFRISAGGPRIFKSMEPDKNIRKAIQAMAKAIGANVETSINDALAFQWVIKAIPA